MDAYIDADLASGMVGAKWAVAVAVTMQLEMRLDLTLTHSSRRGNVSHKPA